jgi:hypothetical protein
VALGGGGTEARRDSLVERGVVDLSGRIKFDTVSSPTGDTEKQNFRDAYQAALKARRTPDGALLFRDVLLSGTKLTYLPKPGQPRVPGSRPLSGPIASPLEVGEFPFRFRCYFPTTALDADSRHLLDEVDTEAPVEAPAESPSEPAEATDEAAP